MILEELHLTGFGKFQNKIFPFKKGLNIIVGDNEAGKSTLFQAIFGVIFGFKSDSDRYRPWHHPTAYQAKLALTSGDHEVQFERNFLDENLWRKILAKINVRERSP